MKWWFLIIGIAAWLIALFYGVAYAFSLSTLKLIGTPAIRAQVIADGQQQLLLMLTAVAVGQLSLLGFSVLSGLSALIRRK